MAINSETLQNLIESGQLSEDEEKAFSDMVETGRPLTKKQKEWAEKVGSRVGVEQGVANLASSGQVHVSDADRTSLKEFLTSLGPKPLKPPGKK